MQKMASFIGWKFTWNCIKTIWESQFTLTEVFCAVFTDELHNFVDETAEVEKNSVADIPPEGITT